MTALSTTFVPYEMKTSIIRVFSYVDKNPKGILQNPYYKEDIPFESLTQLLILIEELQDALNYPQKTMKSRSFQQTADKNLPPLSSGDSFGKEKAALATFKLKILFRQNASWQGSVTWMEKGFESSFRSALELILLMDSVFSE